MPTRLSDAVMSVGAATWMPLLAASKGLPWRRMPWVSMKVLGITRTSAQRALATAMPVGGVTGKVPLNTPGSPVSTSRLLPSAK